MKRCRVGKIACCTVSAWARRTHDFARADKPSSAFAHPTARDEVIE